VATDRDTDGPVHRMNASPTGLANSAQASGPVPARGWTEAGLMLMVLIWGVNFAVVKRALEGFSPLGFNALRYVLASALVYAVLRSRGRLRRPARADLPRIVALGLIGNTLYQLAFILGVDGTRAGNASLMLALVPVFVLMLGFRHRTRHGPRVWIGVVLSVIGVAAVSRSTISMEGLSTLRGDLLMVGAAAVWAIYTAEARPLIEKYGSVQTTAWTLWIGAIGVFLIGSPSLATQEWALIDAAGWGGLAFSALFSIGLAYLIWYRGVERLGGARTAVFINFTPVVALLTGAIWLGETLTPLSVAGAAMVLGGVVLVRSGSAELAPEPPIE
jgi:drug/metabolite transporter (DMT)-like permease